MYEAFMQSNEEYLSSIRYFLEISKNIEGLHDLLVRGSSIDTKKCVANWSGINFTIVVEEITSSVLEQVRAVYQQMITKYPFKISITFVTKKDLQSYRHQHGIKPLYYSAFLQNSVSLLRNVTFTEKKHSLNELKYNCFTNVVYLIHDLRIRYMKENQENMASIIKFCCHLIKTTKHLIRNAIFIRSGLMNKEVDQELFRLYFPKIDAQFPNILDSYKENWAELIKNRKQLIRIINHVFPIVEKIYEDTVCYAEQLEFAPEISLEPI